MNEAERFDELFRRAVAAIDAGDLAALEGLLVEHPDLSHRRLERPGAWLTNQIGPALDSFYKHPYLLWLLTEDAVRTGTLAANVSALARAILHRARRPGDECTEAGASLPVRHPFRSVPRVHPAE